jgi:hypothetical protein
MSGPPTARAAWLPSFGTDAGAVAAADGEVPGLLEVPGAGEEAEVAAVA